MQQLNKTLLVQVAGGVAQAAAAGSTIGNATDDMIEVVGLGDSGGGWEGNSGSAMGDYSSGNDVLAGVGAGPAVGNFDANGVGPTSCVVLMPPAAPVAQGLFGMTLTETLGAGTGALAIGGAIGGAVVASSVVETAGGWGAVGTLGASGVGLGTAAGAGVLASGAAGYAVGTALYNSSETVQEVSQAVVGRVVEVAPEIPGAVGGALIGTFNGQNLGRAGVGP